MSTFTEEYSEAADSLSAILAPLVNKRVDEQMDAYVTKDYLDTVITKLENKMLLYLGSLVALSLVTTLGGIKLMLPASSQPGQPSVIVVQTPANTQTAVTTPAPQAPVTVPAQ